MVLLSLSVPSPRLSMSSDQHNTTVPPITTTQPCPKPRRYPLSALSPTLVLIAPWAPWILCEVQKLIVFDASKRETHHPGNGFKKLARRLKSGYKLQMYVPPRT